MRWACAVGTIGLSLLARMPLASLSCVEINGAGEAAFQRSVQALPSQKQRIPVSYRVAAAGAAPRSELAAADVIVVDPPRKGLEPQLVQTLCQLATHTCEGQQPLTDAPADGSAHSAEALPKRPVRGAVQRLVYLSCGLDALMRDVRALLAPSEQLDGEAAWSIASAEGFVFFPGTDSIETLVVLERSSSTRLGRDAADEKPAD